MGGGEELPLCLLTAVTETFANFKKLFKIHKCIMLQRINFNYLVDSCLKTPLSLIVLIDEQRAGMLQCVHTVRAVDSSQGVELVIWVCGGGKGGIEGVRETDSWTRSPGGKWKICCGFSSVTDFSSVRYWHVLAVHELLSVGSILPIELCLHYLRKQC